MRQVVCVVVVILVVVEQMTALTTSYGNPNKKEEKPQHTPVIVRGRECKMDGDCNNVANTFCMTDHRDRKTRCLCLTKNAPSNGQCPKTPKALRSVCSHDQDCVDGAQCSPPNATSTSTSQTKTCMCRQGYMEEEHMCSSGIHIPIPPLISLTTACTCLLFAAMLL